MKKPVFALFLALAFVMLTVSVSPAAAEEYETLTPPQPTQDASKIEVIEFFWYGCPHCYAFEPLVRDWLKTLPAHVQFIRQPAIFSEVWGKHAKAFFTAEALGILDKVHDALFDAIQNQHRKLLTEEDLGKFFAEHGVKEEDFRNAYRSFLVDTRMRQAEGMAARYGVTGVPALVVNGKYKINTTLAKTHENMLKIADRLIQQETAARSQ